MCKKIFILIALFILPLSSMAFPQAQPQKPPEEPPQKPPEEPIPVLAVPKDYRYTSHGRRDPFVNPIPKPVTPLLQPEGLQWLFPRVRSRKG